METLGRPEPNRNIHRDILIALEDEESARLYFEGFARERKSIIEITIADHEGSHPSNVIEAAKKAKKERSKLVEDGFADPYDEIWVVFDTEGPQHPNRPLAARAAIEQARDLMFHTAVSNPSFEYWLLLHFEYLVTTFANGAAVCRKLREHIEDYEKGATCFERVRPLTPVAIRHAIRNDERYKYISTHPCDCHPSTQVHVLVMSILGTPPPKIPSARPTQSH